MKFKLSKIICLSILFTSFFTLSTSSINVGDNTEFSWYFVQRVKNTPPEAPKEIGDILSDGSIYYQGNINEKELYLTFDEGYERGNTSAILDTLKKLNVKAAFFVVKPFIKEQPDLINRMVNEGHLVCNHSSHHPSMASITDPEKFKKEFTEVEEEFTKVTGKEMPKFFRPPMGRYSKSSLQKTKELGYKTVFWTFAYKDWLINDQPSQEKGIEKIKKGVFPGCIILLHAVSDTNTKILEKVLTDLIKEGYTFKSLEELP